MSGIRVTWLPILQIVILALGTLASFITSYTIGDVTVYLPYISETGGWAPASCIFTLTIICGSFLGVMVVVVRYLIVADLAKDEPVLRANSKALYIGLLSWFGLAIVGAFPMSTVLAVHLVGAAIHFSLGLIYVLTQTGISHKLTPIGDRSRVIVKIRIGLCACLLTFLLLLLIIFPIAQVNWKKQNGDIQPAQKLPEDHGFTLVVASSFFEWAMYTAFLGYFATFVVEFRNYRVTALVQLAKDDEGPSRSLDQLGCEQ